MFSNQLRRALQSGPVYALAAFLMAERVRVNGWSMHPVLAPGERVLFDRLAYRWTDPAPGEIVLARDPRDGRLLIKQVGDTQGEDGYVLLGTNPEFSSDSRHFGPVARSALLARAWLVYWSPERFRVLH